MFHGLFVFLFFVNVCVRNIQKIHTHTHRVKYCLVQYVFNGSIDFEAHLRQRKS